MINTTQLNQPRGKLFLFVSLVFLFLTVCMYFSLHLSLFFDTFLPLFLFFTYLSPFSPFLSLFLCPIAKYQNYDLRHIFTIASVIGLHSATKHGLWHFQANISQMPRHALSHACASDLRPNETQMSATAGSMAWRYAPENVNPANRSEQHTALCSSRPQQGVEWNRHKEGRNCR